MIVVVERDAKCTLTDGSPERSLGPWAVTVDIRVRPLEKQALLHLRTKGIPTVYLLLPSQCL